MYELTKRREIGKDTTYEKKREENVTRNESEKLELVLT